MRDAIPSGELEQGTAHPLDLVPVEQLGEGSYGVVYRARTPGSDVQVALKVLRHPEPDTIARFKREFRTLTDIHHRNLVTLHQLACDEDRWLFSMEYVEGVDLLQWVSHGVRSFGPQAVRSTDPDSERDTRLRSVLVQAIDGLTALHRAGHLHRDLKPSNVLVTREGRAVILDFGLAGELHAATRRRAGDPAGSPAYMSPEQSARAAVGAATDAYSLGVILFEALAGRLPFEGPSRELLARKQVEEAPDVRQLAPDAAEDLASLCNALLARSTARRATLAEARRRLEPDRRAPDHATGETPAGFFGRERELERLESAYRQMREQRRPVVALVHGPSGMGKSALVQRFGRRVSGRRTVVLSARCYEQETMPYKGMDGIIDALAQYLQTLTDEELARVLPPDVGLLARVFPVLAQVLPVAEARLTTVRPPDPAAERDIAVRALVELLRRIAERRALVVAVDDIHWGDRDSGGLLNELLQAEPPLPVLWILSCRERGGRAPMLDILRSDEAPTGASYDIPVEPLPPEQCRGIVRSRLDHGHVGLVEAIARESGGVPLFLTQLTEHARTTGQVAGLSLTQVLASRLQELTPVARRYLQAVAVFGRPVPRLLVDQAADAVGEHQNAIATLRAARLIRTVSDSPGRVLVEPYHDRIRQAVVQAMEPDERRSLHAAWAAVLADHGWSDPEDRASHLQGAGDLAGAARATARAAHRAAESLAWDRAARLYRRALELGAAEASTAHGWQLQRARALANASRGAEAAEVYRELAARSTGAERRDLQRQAAEQLLRSGRMDEGFDALREVLSAFEVPFPERPWTSLFALARERSRLRLRGLGFERRPSAHTGSLQRVDTCLSAALGLGGIDTLRGAYFQSLALRLALDAGEPHRIARSLAFEAAFQCSRGRRGSDRATSLIEQTHELAQELGDPYLLSLVEADWAVAAFHAGRWSACLAHARRAEATLRDRCTGVAKELVTVRLFTLAALTQLGRFTDLSSTIREWLADAQRRGDVYASTNLRIGLPNLVWLARDDPEEAERQAVAAMADWNARGFLIPDFFHLMARTEADLYRGRGAQAQRRLRAARPELRSSHLSVVQVIRILERDLSGRAWLASTASTSGSRAHRRERARAEGCARALEREEAPWGQALGHRLGAALAWARGDPAEARVRLETAAAGFETAGMAAHATTARLGVAGLRGTRDSTAVRHALLHLESLGVRRPDRFIRLHLPGPLASALADQIAIGAAP